MKNKSNNIRYMYLIEKKKRILKKFSDNILLRYAIHKKRDSVSNTKFYCTYV